MQLYAGLPIITNKITLEEQAGIPHHLLGCIGLHEQSWVVGTFVKQALKTIKEIRSRGRLPILVGGTHYYTQSLLFHDRLAEKESDAAVEPGEGLVDDREERWPMLSQSTAVLLEELKKVDPVMAERWHPNDRRKIQRSLEVYLQTGRRASDVYAEQRARKDVTVPAGGEEDGSSEVQSGLRVPTLLFWVHADKQALHQRLDHRVDSMFESGLLDEVQSLNAFAKAEEAAGTPVDETRGIWVSIGYKEFKAYTAALEDPQASENELEKLRLEALERTKIATRQYAKRQLRWIRIKLVNALSQFTFAEGGGSQGHLYLLDGSDASTFEENVVSPAIDLTSTFLSGGQMLDPKAVSDVAAEMLTPKREYDYSARPEKWTKRFCEVCGVTCVTEEQWEAHKRSKRHRKMINYAKKAPKGGGEDD